MKRRKHKRHAKVVTSGSGRKYRKSTSSRTGWVLVSGGKRKKRHTKKRHAKKRKTTKRRRHTSKFW